MWIQNNHVFNQICLFFNSFKYDIIDYIDMHESDA